MSGFQVLEQNGYFTKIDIFYVDFNDIHRFSGLKAMTGFSAAYRAERIGIRFMPIVSLGKYGFSYGVSEPLPSNRYLDKVRAIGYTTLQLPLQAIVRVGKRTELYAGLGGNWRFYQNHNEYITFRDAPGMGKLYNDIPDFYRRWRFNYSLGVGRTFGNYSLELIYQQDFGSVVRDVTYLNETYPINVNARYLSLMFSYRIPLGKKAEKTAPPAEEYYAPQ